MERITDLFEKHGGKILLIIYVVIISWIIIGPIIAPKASENIEIEDKNIRGLSIDPKVDTRKKRVIQRRRKEGLHV